MAKPKAFFSVHLDAIRGIAALIVFTGHARILFISTVLGAIGIGAHAPSAQVGLDSRPVTEIVNPSHQAVIIFFVLSGFLVGGAAIRSWSQNKWSWKEYALQRLVRLWAVLIPALVIGAILDNYGSYIFGFDGIYGSPKSQQLVPPDFTDRLSWSAFFGSAFFVQGILTRSFGSNSPLWTLAYEFWFYVSFPILLGLFTNRLPIIKRAMCLLVLVAIGLLVGERIILYFLLWLAGAMLELAPKKIPPKLARMIIPFATAGFIGVCAVLLKLKLNLYLSDVIETIAFCAFCYVLIHQTETIKESQYTRISRFLSNMSYTLYLTHTPIIVFLCAAIMGASSLWPLDITSVLKFIGVLLFAFFCSYVIYWYFERNTDRLRTVLRAKFNLS